MSISLHVSSRSPTGSLPLVMHLANGQTMPVLPGPPVQMPSVISVSSVVGAANSTNTIIPPFHLNAHKHTWAPGKHGLWSILSMVACPNTSLIQHYGILNKDSSGQLAPGLGIDLASLLIGWFHLALSTSQIAHHFPQYTAPAFPIEIVIALKD